MTTRSFLYWIPRGVSGPLWVGFSGYLLYLHRAYFHLPTLMLMSAMALIALLLLFMPPRNSSSSPWWIVSPIYGVSCVVLLFFAYAISFHSQMLFLFRLQWHTSLHIPLSSETFFALLRRPRCSTPASWCFLIALIPAIIYALPWFQRRQERWFSWSTIAFLWCWALLLVGLGFTLYASPAPIIDVWSIQTEAADCLRVGKNPYTFCYTNIYEQTGQDFRPAYPMLYIYLPFLLMPYLPLRLLALDIRWFHLFALAGLWLTLWRLEQNHTNPSGMNRLTLLLFLFMPANDFLLEQSWAEGILLWYLALIVAFAHRPWFCGLMLGLLLSTKQTAFLMFPFILLGLCARTRWRIAGIAMLVAALIQTPFFLSAPGAYWHNCFVDLWQKPPALHSLSWYAFFLHWGFRPAPLPVSAYLFYGAILLWAWQRRKQPLADATDTPFERSTLGWLGVALLFFFLFLKQSFFNYYYLTLGILALYYVTPGDGMTRRNS